MSLAKWGLDGFSTNIPFRINARVGKKGSLAGMDGAITVPIAEILSGKNARTWVSMVFT